MMMTMIGDPPRLNPTVQIPSYDIHSPISYYNNSPDTSKALAALQRFLPSNNLEDSDDAYYYSCDDFRMYELKVTRCARSRSHDWTECPFAHPGEKARRRDPRRYHYSGAACPEFRKAGGYCKRGDACEFSHGVFECWLHPARYRTQPCKYGTHCKRRVCFFAHTPDQLRPNTATLLVESSMRSLNININKKNMGLDGFGTGPGLSRRYGSPTLVSLPSTPVRAMWEASLEPVMERVESGRMLRQKIYAKLLEKENSFAPSNSDPDIGWVSELLI